MPEMGTEYEDWFVRENGPRPQPPRGTDDRIKSLRAELHALEDMQSRTRDWDTRYLAGRAALVKFGRSDL
ncbi:MAG: hypothetical protein V4537_14245 [Pseudomonadota bacterium]